MGKKSDELLENIKDLIEMKKKSSFQIYKLALQYSSISNKRLFILFIFFIITFCMIYFLIFPRITALNLIASISSDINTIIIPLFAVIITGYAIFQALVNESTTKILLKVKDKKSKSKYMAFNLYFYGISISYLIIIIINFCLIMITKYLPTDLYLPFLPCWLNEVLSAFIISFYISIVLFLLVELKSFVYNLFQVFFTNGSVTGIAQLRELVESENKEENKEE